MARYFKAVSTAFFIVATSSMVHKFGLSDFANNETTLSIMFSISLIMFAFVINIRD